jgi:tetratricopeptide (TPR) repeat protein
MEEFEKAIALNPKDGIAYIDIGTVYFFADQPERALDAFAEAVFADPGRYGPVVISQLQRLSYTWKEDVEKIGQGIAKKQGMDLDTLTTREHEDILQAHHYFEIGLGFFQSGRYKEALEQFEKGKLVTNKFPGNYFGVSMTAMQMIEVGAIPKNQFPIYLEKADLNIDQCLQIAPTNLDYISAKKIIGEYKNKHRKA